MFTKYFDSQASPTTNYGRKILVFFIERSSFRESDPEIYEEYIQGNLGSEQEQWSAFCAVRVHIAL